MNEINPINTLVASVLLFVLDDFLYNLAHRFMHWRPVYPWIHKIHHRQYLPERGYWDAAIEHPIEQIVGLGVFWIALDVVFRVTGMHLTGFLFSFLFYSFFNIVNHMPYDTQFMFLGFTYSTRAHEMHHRYPNCNFSKSCMLWDKLLGTYRPYHAIEKRNSVKSK
jgi:sterol desaturase/sphingolipid hydroxylase (fatty acid hydroxylase superfamily)